MLCRHHEDSENKKDPAKHVENRNFLVEQRVLFFLESVMVLFCSNILPGNSFQTLSTNLS